MPVRFIGAILFEPKETSMSTCDSIADYDSEQLYGAGETRISGLVERSFNGATN
jgi:hypothetical protein